MGWVEPPGGGRSRAHPVCPPACQCNGHSRCVNESVCEKCENLTSGRHCESCISGFYGDPTNGGSCQRECMSGGLDGDASAPPASLSRLLLFLMPSLSLAVTSACKCNGHAGMCNPNNGKCFCTTKGIKGDRCHL